MKLPMCAHCGKLLVGQLSKTAYVMGSGGMSGHLEYETRYFCPERREPMEPVWMEVDAKVL